MIWCVFHFAPDDQSRVVLQKDYPTDADYINANYIPVSCTFHLIVTTVCVEL